MKFTLPFLLILALAMTSLPSSSVASGRVNSVIRLDTTERLESIALLKQSLKKLNVELSVLHTALEEAQKKPSHKKIYVNTRKIADAITALTILGGAIASYHFDNSVKVIKIASFIGGLSSSTSVLSSLMADLSSDEADVLKGKIGDLKTIIKASTINLNNEVKILCKSEPSNQMCR